MQYLQLFSSARLKFVHFDLFDIVICGFFERIDWEGKCVWRRSIWIGRGFLTGAWYLSVERKAMKYVQLTLRVGGALGLLRRWLVVLLRVGCLLHLLSFPAFSHICYESLADLFVWFVFI